MRAKLDADFERGVFVAAIVMVIGLVAQLLVAVVVVIEEEEQPKDQPSYSKSWLRTKQPGQVE